MTTAAAIAIARRRVRLESRHQLGHRCEAPPALGLEPALEDPAQPGRQVARMCERKPGEHRLADRVGIAGERPLAVQRLVQRAREGELIGARVDRAAGVLLGRHVAGRAHHGVVDGEPRRRGAAIAGGSVGVGGVGGVGGVDLRGLPARQAEVGDARATIAGHQHVVGLEIAMHQAGDVRRVQAAAGAGERGDDLVPRARFGEPAPQGHALDVLHRNEQAIVGQADVVHGDHVGVREPSHRLRLAEQAGPPLPVAAHAAELLDRHGAAEIRVVRAVDHAHAARADQLLDDVAPQHGAALEPGLLGNGPGRRRGAHGVRHGGRVDGLRRLASRSALGLRVAHGAALRLRGRGSS
jgi:hypothetical protein